MRGQLEEQAIRTGLQHEVLFLGQHDNVPGCSANRISLSILAFKITSRTRLWKPKWQASRASYRPQGIARNGNSRFHGIVSPCRRSGKHGRAPQFAARDEDYRKFLGDNAKTFAYKHWSMDLMIERMLNIYYGAIAQKSSR